MVSFGLSDVGRKRKNNQDSFGIFDIASNAKLFVVCDGMGGASGGNVASEMAVEVFSDYVKRALLSFVGQNGRLVLPSVDDGDDLSTTSEFLLAETRSFTLSGPFAAVQPMIDAEKAAQLCSLSDGGEKTVMPSAVDGNVVDDASGAAGDAGADGDGNTVGDGATGFADGNVVGDGNMVGDGNTVGDGIGEDDIEREFVEDETGETTMFTSYPEVLLRNAAYEANAAVYKRATEESELSGMGTTLVAALVIDGVIYVANVGDSRAYLFRDGEMTQLTHDHSLVQYLVDIGQITPEEALVHYARNVITKAVGSEPELEADTAVYDFSDGVSYLLLCTDGLTNFVPPDDLKDAVLGYDTESVEYSEMMDELEDKVTLIINSANDNGGGDNITALLVKNVAGGDF